ncbi:hypothetical protein BD311DRAFT_318453 [Dichomitus squalens]|uniref:Uncharacterized protein n=1 Tax=Dichomitus squalens TaxID=114155 RepID=A0A4Q9MNS7_9APHY|nr:hypothetical protein BD311DRAFT_318453 [Dichomitus squalens]
MSISGRPRSLARNRDQKGLSHMDPPGGLRREVLQYPPRTARSGRTHHIHVHVPESDRLLARPLLHTPLPHDDHVETRTIIRFLRGPARCLRKYVTCNQIYAGISSSTPRPLQHRPSFRRQSAARSFACPPPPPCAAAAEFNDKGSTHRLPRFVHAIVSGLPIFHFR